MKHASITDDDLRDIENAAKGGHAEPHETWALLHELSLLRGHFQRMWVACGNVGDVPSAKDVERVVRDLASRVSALARALDLAYPPRTAPPPPEDRGADPLFAGIDGRVVAGLTLRDLAALVAMHALIPHVVPGDVSDLAAGAVRVADGVLRELARPAGEG